MASIRGGKVKSIATLKSSMKKGGGSGYLSRVPADGAITVRFLTEPDEWVTYFEHYDSVRKFYPCTDDCPGCTEGDRPSARYLANVVDVSETRVIPLVMPKSMAASVLKKYDKYATILDRDYELSRSGTGLDTEYDVTPEPPTKMNLDRFDAIDLMELLEEQLEMADSAKSDDDDEDEKPRSRKAAKSSPKAAEVEEDEDDDDLDLDEDEDEDEEGESDYWTRDQLDGKSLAELKQIAKDLEWTAADIKGLDVDGLIDLIVGDADEDEDDEDEDEDDVPSDDDSDEDDESEDSDLTEDDLRSMSLTEVKKVARELGVRFKPGTSKDDIVDLILDAAAEDDDDDEEVPF